MNTLQRLLVLAQQAPHGQTAQDEFERQGVLEQAKEAIAACSELTAQAKVAHSRMVLAMANDHSRGTESGVRHEHCEGLRIALNAFVKALLTPLSPINHK